MISRFFGGQGRFALPFALMLFAAPALAQQPATPQAAPSGAPVALATTPPAASHIAVALELMQQIGAARMFEAFIPNMQSQITGVVTRTRPELSADLKTVLTDVQPEFDQQKKQLLDSAILVFARAMTEQEIKDTLTFIKTPAGQKFLDTQGQAVNTIVVMLDQWSKQMSVDMFARVREGLQKKGHDF